MLKFAKTVPYLLDPARSRPHVSQTEQALAASDPPHAVPFHCKPWLDGQTAGWTLSYGYLTPVSLSTSSSGALTIDGIDLLAAETQQPRIIDSFAPGHFGIGSGYTLQTPPGYVSLLLPPTSPPAGLKTVTGIIESDWYPRQIFLVFELPAPGLTIKLDRGVELARVLVIPRQEQLEARPLTAAEQEDLEERRQQYLAEEKTTTSCWTAASGDQFTHLYKIWSQAHRQ